MHGVTSHVTPLNPSGQSHKQSDPEIFSVPPFKHSSTSHGVISQSVPEYPAGQVHTYPEPSTAQVPPFWHGADVQGVTSQLSPEKPAGQAQLHDAGGPALSTLTPLFSHVIRSHGVISHVVPV